MIKYKHWEDKKIENIHQGYFQRWPNSQEFSQIKTYVGRKKNLIRAGTYLPYTQAAGQWQPAPQEVMGRNGTWDSATAQGQVPGSDRKTKEIQRQSNDCLNYLIYKTGILNCGKYTWLNDLAIKRKN